MDTSVTAVVFSSDFSRIDKNQRRNSDQQTNLRKNYVYESSPSILEDKGETYRIALFTHLPIRYELSESCLNRCSAKYEVKRVGIAWPMYGELGPAVYTPSVIGSPTSQFSIGSLTSNQTNQYRGCNPSYPYSNCWTAIQLLKNSSRAFFRTYQKNSPHCTSAKLFASRLMFPTWCLARQQNPQYTIKDRTCVVVMVIVIRQAQGWCWCLHARCHFPAKCTREFALGARTHALPNS